MASDIFAYWVKKAGMLLVDTAVAILGVTIINWMIFWPRVHSMSAMIWEAWILSISLAASAGFLMYRRWRSSTARWVWLLPALWFGLGVFAIGSSHVQSVLREPLWTPFSGISCYSSPNRKACLVFFLFTIPLVRTICYSSVALLSSQIYTQPPVIASRVQVPNRDGDSEGTRA